VVGSEVIITAGVTVFPDGDEGIVVEMDDDVKAISNLVPGEPGGELKDNLIVIPELKPPVRRINRIDELNVDHVMLHELEAMFDPRGPFLDLWPDARMLCQNLKRAAVHAIGANEVGKNRNVFVFW
ncbi:MAG: hypothetical protein KAH57_11835, partial [Thermoplasmata archaeon]|nr:hypothetical protein [Thermoplasmata archaeon]